MEHFVSPESHPLLCKIENKIAGLECSGCCGQGFNCRPPPDLWPPTSLLHTLRYQVFLTFPIVEKNNAVAVFPSVVWIGN
jgi:hypothetical protein